MANASLLTQVQPMQPLLTTTFELHCREPYYYGYGCISKPCSGFLLSNLYMTEPLVYGAQTSDVAGGSGSGVTTVGAIGGTSNANGATITGNLH